MTPHCFYISDITQHISMVKLSEKNQCQKIFVGTSLKQRSPLNKSCLDFSLRIWWVYDNYECFFSQLQSSSLLTSDPSSSLDLKSRITSNETSLDIRATLKSRYPSNEYSHDFFRVLKYPVVHLSNQFLSSLLSLVYHKG